MQLTQKQIENFRPTKEMIKTTQEVFLCMAKVGTIKPIVEEIQKKVLKKYQFKVSAEWREDKERIITEPKQSYLMTNEDFKIYHSECRILEDEKELYVSNSEFCPLLVAENDRRKAENRLMNAFSCITGLDSNKINMRLDSRKKFLDLTLKYMAQFVNKEDCLKHIGYEVSKNGF